MIAFQLFTVGAGITMICKIETHVSLPQATSDDASQFTLAGLTQFIVQAMLDDVHSSQRSHDTDKVARAIWRNRTPFASRSCGQIAHVQWYEVVGSSHVSSSRPWQAPNKAVLNHAQIDIGRLNLCPLAKLGCLQ